MKKKLLFFAVPLFFILIEAKSQTNVSGKLTQNTTWTTSGSPYLLTDNVEVPTDVTLTIEPGVTVQRTSRNEITVNGTLIANGTLTDSIFLVTNDLTDISTPPFLEFTKCNLSNTSLRFVRFESITSQGKNIRIGSSDESSSPIKNSGILSISRSNLSDGNIVSHGFNSGISMNLDSCYFDSSTIHCLDSYSEKINITNSTIVNSTEQADELSYGILDSNCVINNDVLESGAHTNVYVVASTMNGSIVNVPQDATFFMSHSTTTNTPVFGSPGGIVNIDESDLNESNADTALYPKINSVPYLIVAFQANITNSTFNGTNDIDALAINGTGGDTTTTIAHNTFTKFADAVTVYDFSSQMHIDSNNFVGMKTYDIINYSDRNFDAIYDYFSLTGDQTIDDLIYDHKDNPAYGLVNYIPYATGEVLPLSLISFTGTYNNHQVWLQWQTANEVNTSQFVVQRLTGSSYQDIGTLAAKGAANNSYLFNPSSLTEGTNIYRLKMIDKDGNFSYSASINVVVSSLSSAFTLYPNPATNFVLVNHTKAAPNSQLEVTDMNGKVITTVVVAAGEVQNKIVLNGISKGIYKIIWRNGNTIQSKALLVN